MFGNSSAPRTRLNRLVWSYLPDWVLVIIMALAFFAIDKIHPFRREFSLEDKTIQHPMKPDTVTPTMLIIISFVIPIVVIFFNAVFIRRSWFDLHQGWLGCMLALTLTIMVTHTLKVTVGRLRPDFIDRCKLDRSNGTPTDPGIGLSNSSLCTQTNSKILRDGMKSFPSGHSSMTFAGMTYLTLYLAGKLHIHDQKGHTIKTFITIMPLLGAALVAVSRTCDYRHHWQDVTIGSIIGILCAYFAYRQYYPRLASLTSHRPYSPRIPADDDEMGQGRLARPQRFGASPENSMYPIPERTNPSGKASSAGTSHLNPHLPDYNDTTDAQTISDDLGYTPAVHPHDATAISVVPYHANRSGGGNQYLQSQPSSSSQSGNLNIVHSTATSTPSTLNAPHVLGGLSPTYGNHPSDFGRTSFNSESELLPDTNSPYHLREIRTNGQ
ncbi:hypothetical protein H4R33_003589 [Dimargaris cristalligena]|nr:hypothetical protein H4R33_003589 [Dimargaris cristalligena]